MLLSHRHTLTLALTAPTIATQALICVPSTLPDSLCHDLNDWYEKSRIHGCTTIQQLERFPDRSNPASFWQKTQQQGYLRGKVTCTKAIHLKEKIFLLLYYISLMNQSCHYIYIYIYNTIINNTVGKKMIMSSNSSFPKKNQNQNQKINLQQ